MVRKWLKTSNMYLNIDKILAFEILRTGGGGYWEINIITDSNNKYIYDDKSYLFYEEAKQDLDELIKTLCS